MTERPGEVIMPFLPIESNGGPYDDLSYAAGFELGRLYVLLEFGKADYWEGRVRTPNVEQADLTCMRFGWVIEWQVGDDEFTFLRIRRTTSE